MFIVRTAMPLFKRVFRTYDELNNVVQENVQAIRVVKTFNQEEHEKKKFGAVSERIYELFSKAERTMTLNMPLMQSCMYSLHAAHILDMCKGHSGKRKRSCPGTYHR